MSGPRPATGQQAGVGLRGSRPPLLGKGFTDHNRTADQGGGLELLIHGARGIVYFNHSFGGPCVSQHVLREDCGAAVRPTVTAVNQQITELAPVLNSPTVHGLVTASGGSVDLAVKAHGGHFYVLAAATSAGPQQIAFSVACGTPLTAQVLAENRTVPVSANSFTDTFADSNSVHIYQLNGGNTCGLGLS